MDDARLGDEARDLHTITPWSDANPDAIFITGDRNSTTIGRANDPTGPQVSLCSISRADKAYCIHSDLRTRSKTFGKAQPSPKP